MITYRYKDGYIHDNFTDDIIRVQFGFDVHVVRSVHAAKIFITNRMKK